MSTISYSFRIDSKTKEEFDKICQVMGMSPATAYNIFAKRVVVERGFPFTPTAALPSKPSVTAALQRIQSKTRDYDVSEDEVLNLVMSGRQETPKSSIS